MTAKRFIDQPLWRRKKAMVAKRWRATQNTEGFGRFFSHVVIPGTKEWAQIGLSGLHGHTEVRFASRCHAHKGWWYHASFASLPVHANQVLNDLVDQRLEHRLSEVGLSTNFALGLNSFFDTHEIKNPQLEEFDGRSYYDLELEEWERIDFEDYKHLQLNFDLSFDCPRAVDLMAVVPERHIDVHAVINIIDRFMECGERSVAFPTDIDLYRADIEQSIGEQKSFIKQLI